MRQAMVCTTTLYNKIGTVSESVVRSRGYVHSVGGFVAMGEDICQKRMLIVHDNHGTGQVSMSPGGGLVQ